MSKFLSAIVVVLALAFVAEAGPIQRLKNFRADVLATRSSLLNRASSRAAAPVNLSRPLSTIRAARAPVKAAPKAEPPKAK